MIHDGDYEFENEVDRWLTTKINDGRGLVSLGYTEDGDIGVFLPGQEKSVGVGDTAHEAMTDAVRRNPLPPVPIEDIYQIVE